MPEVPARVGVHQVPTRNVKPTESLSDASNEAALPLGTIA